MKNLIVLTFFVHLLASRALALVPYRAYSSQLSAARSSKGRDEHFCLVFNGRVGCWGTDRYGESEAPEDLNRATAVATASGISCAVAGNALRCWGRKDAVAIFEHPPFALKNPRDLAIGIKSDDRLHGICALDDEGVRCWPASNFDPHWIESGTGRLNAIANPMNFSHPGNSSSWPVAVGTNGVFALFSDYDRPLGPIKSEDQIREAAGIDVISRFGVGGGTSHLESLAHPRNLVSSTHQTCAIADGPKGDPFIWCSPLNWGGNEHMPDFRDPRDAPKNLTALAITDFNACALNPEGLQCWGLETDHPNHPALMKDLRLTATGLPALSHLRSPVTCGLSDTELRCQNGYQGLTGDLSDVHALSVSSDADGGALCWLKDRQALCRGDGGRIFTISTSAKDVAAVGRNGCALTDQDEIRCRDMQRLDADDDIHRGSFPGARKMKVVGREICLIDAEGLECVSVDSGTRRFVQAMGESQDFITAAAGLGRSLTCRLENTKLQCWPSGQDPFEIPLDESFKAQKIDLAWRDGWLCDDERVGYDRDRYLTAYLCVQGERRVKCWSKTLWDEGSYVNRELPLKTAWESPDLGRIQNFFSDGDLNIVTDKGLTKLDIPQTCRVQPKKFIARLDIKAQDPVLKKSDWNRSPGWFFAPANFESDLAYVVAPHLYTAKKNFLLAVSAYLGTWPEAGSFQDPIAIARYFVMRALEAFMNAMSSAYAQQVFVPRYNDSLALFESRTGLNALNTFPHDRSEVEAALSISSQALLQLKALATNAEDRAAIESLVALAGQALAEPSRIPIWVKAYRDQHAMMQRLQLLAEAQAFVATVDGLATFLE